MKCAQACVAPSLRSLSNLACDACVAAALLLVHGAALMAQVGGSAPLGLPSVERHL